jgi:heavy metal sensor kinase
MIMSFRLRIFITAAAIVAIVLAVVMTTAWFRVMEFEVGRLDARLCSEAKRLAMERFPSEDLQRLEGDIEEKLRLGNSELLLRFVDASDGREYQSKHWDDAVDLGRLDWAQVADTRRSNTDGLPGGRRGDPQGPVCDLASFNSHSDQWRVASSEVSQARGLVAANLAAPKTEIRHALQSALLIEIPISLILTALGAWLLSAFALKPINRLRESMKAVTPTALDQRLSGAAQDQEFKELITAYNTMLERLERSFQQASRFSSDAAHELKTPLTILRGRIEQVRRKAGDDELRADLSDLLDEVSRLSAITRKLLLLSHADAGKLELSLTQVDLTNILTEVMADAQLMAEDKVLTASIPDNLSLKGDALLLRQLINNLLSNSIRYSSPGGFISVQATQSCGMIEVRFANSSRAIAQPERLRFFERFFRGDAAHNRAVEGNGLGLSLAFEIAKAHKGDLALQPSSETEVHLLLTLPFE